MSYFNVITLNL